MDYREDPQNHPHYRHHFGFQSGMPPLLKSLIIINVAVFLVQMFVPQGKPDIWLTHFFGLYYPWAIGRAHLWQFLTYAFMHGSVSHILMNMLFLWMFGREIEPVLGRRRFLVFYLSAAVFSGLLYVCFDFLNVAARGRSPVPCVGASGVVMAVAMMYAMYWPNRTVLFMFIIPMRVRTLVLIVIVVELLGVLNVQNPDKIAHAAHLGGLLWGVLFVRYGAALERFFVGRRFSARRSRPPSRPDDDPQDSRQLDAILDKINRQGIQSLSRSEKRFLKKLGERR